MSRILVTTGRAAMLFFTMAQGASAQGGESDGGDAALRMVTFEDQEMAAVQSSPACPDGICHGLGNIFFLPAIDAQSVNTGGQVFLKNRRLGECAQLNFLGGRITRDFSEAESMERSVQSQMAEANLHGSATRALLSVEGTVQTRTTYSSQIEERFSALPSWGCPSPRGPAKPRPRLSPCGVWWGIPAGGTEPAGGAEWRGAWIG